MKEYPSAVKAIVEALNSYDSWHKEKIKKLECEIEFLKKERAAFIRHLEAGNIELLKNYLQIEEK